MEWHMCWSDQGSNKMFFIVTHTLAYIYDIPCIRLIEWFLLCGWGLNNPPRQSGGVNVYESPPSYILYSPFRIYYNGRPSHLPIPHSATGMQTIGCHGNIL